MSGSDVAAVLGGTIAVCLLMSAALPLLFFPKLVQKPISRLNAVWLLVWLGLAAPALVVTVMQELVGLLGYLPGSAPEVRLLLAFSNQGCFVVLAGCYSMTFVLAQSLWVLLADVGNEIARQTWRRTTLVETTN